MKLDYVREFVVLAKEGNFIRAAQKLSIAQGSLSQHIKQLEKEFGFPLFKRSTRNVSLTKFGAAFLTYADSMTSINKEILAIFSQPQNRDYNDISIGHVPPTNRFDAPATLEDFRTMNPDINYSFYFNDSTEDHISRVNSGELDFAIVEESETHVINGFDKLIISSDILCAVLPAAHPLAKYPRILLSMISNETFYLMPKVGFIGNLSLEACLKAGFMPNVKYTDHYMSKIIKLVEKESCVSLLLKRPAAHYLTTGTVLVDIEPVTSSDLTLICYREKLSPQGLQFWEYMKTRCENNSQ